ncbi:MAG: serine/threonine-protein kinase [Pirellulaceae bacterium]
MVDEPGGSTDRDRQVNEIITAYSEAVSAGQVPDRQEWLRRYPELAGELEAFLADHERAKSMAEPLWPAGMLPPEQPEGMVSGEAATLDSGQPTGLPAGTAVRYIGDYELLEQIGQGGMGVVYKARQVSLNRIVALKMILAGQLAGDVDVKRFHAEAEAVANLDHPGIVPIYEIGEHEGHHYFSMGFIEGESLADRIKDGPLPPRQAAEYTCKVAQAVAFAHQRGVIHRDLKPANVLLDRNGEPKVTDFGLAKRAEGDSGLTATGQILGTPSYMLPEQAAGKTNEVGPVSDVYSLGAMLYCLLTGRPPFQSANAMDTLLQVLEQDPVPPRQLNRTVPPALEIVCLKCLSKKPEKRYTSAEDLKNDLVRFLSGETIEALPGAPLARFAEVAKRNSWLTLLLMTAVPAALVYVGASPLAFAIGAGSAASLGVTLRVCAEAFALGAGLGIAVGFLMRFSKTVRIAMTTLLWPAQVPSLALLSVIALTTFGVPYTYMLLGIGETRLLVVGALVVFPRIALAVGDVANNYVLDKRWAKFKTIDTTLRDVRLLVPLCFWTVYVSDLISVAGETPGLYVAYLQASRKLPNEELRAWAVGTLLLVAAVALLFDLGIVALNSKMRRIYVQHPEPS